MVVKEEAVEEVVIEKEEEDERENRINEAMNNLTPNRFSKNSMITPQKLFNF